MKRQLSVFKVAFQSPLSVLWILRCAQYDKSVFKSPFHEDGASASKDKAVFIHGGGAVVVVVVVVDCVKDIFHACCEGPHTLVYAYGQAKVADEIGFEFERVIIYDIKAHIVITRIFGFYGLGNNLLVAVDGVLKPHG